MTFSKQLTRPGFRTPVRTRVLWYGSSGPTSIITELHNRGLLPENITDQIRGRLFLQTDDNGPLAGEALSQLSASKAFIFFTDTDYVDEHTDFLIKTGRHLIDHGLLLCCYVQDDDVRDRMLDAVQQLTFVSKKLNVEIPVVHFVRVWPGAEPQAHELPERINQWDSGPPYSPNLKFTKPLSNSLHATLLRRAFGDCNEISVTQLDGGFSATGVYLVSAVLRDLAFVSRPLPFFAKIDSLPKIMQEMQVYRELVHPGVPFNSRPALNQDRSFLAHSVGVIVGDFVEGSESFYDIARRGNCHRTIHNLFDHALRGWRGQAYESSSSLRQGNIIEDLFRDVNTQVPSGELFAAAKVLGAKEPYEKLKNALISAGEMKFRVAPYHGDLYGNNIRVRAGDSILIDFASSKVAVSLMADPAYLEVSLAFNEYKPNDSFHSWKKTITTLYSLDLLLRAPEPPIRPAPREWLWNAVRHIRLVALGAQESPPREYQVVLAFFLLREAGFDPPTDSRQKRKRRAYAYVLAEKLIKALLNQQEKTKKNAK